MAGMAGEPLAGPARPEIKPFATRFDVKARFVRIWAKNIGLCPAWHPVAGGKAWVFVDEVVVE